MLTMLPSCKISQVVTNDTFLATMIKSVIGQNMSVLKNLNWLINTSLCRELFVTYLSSAHHLLYRIIGNHYHGQQPFVHHP